MSSWLERYRSGDLVQVWTEIVAVGPDLWLDARTLKDAGAVAQETMRRARANVERLVELLPSVGYVFAQYDEQPVFEAPDAGIVGQLDVLEGRIGALPLALRAWYEEVGRVNLVGSHPEWEYAYDDALVVDAPIDYVSSEYELWEADRGTERERSRFVIDLAPDYLHKANVSGGVPYGVEVPSRSGDCLLIGEHHQTTFVNYLRIAFRWGGFPGWDRGAVDGWARPATSPPVVLRELADAMQPL